MEHKTATCKYLTVCLPFPFDLYKKKERMEHHSLDIQGEQFPLYTNS